METESVGLNGAATAEPVATPPSGSPAVTSASGWHRLPPPAPVELPSGNVALLRKPQLLAMMKTGQIPNPLLEAAVSAVSGKASPDYVTTAQFIDFLTAAAFVEPKVILEGDPADGELLISDISDGDKSFVVAWARAEARAVEPFREERPGAAGGGDGGDVRDQAEPAAVD